jgi:branched-chain amino acid transport system permease protein
VVGLTLVAVILFLPQGVMGFALRGRAAGAPAGTGARRPAVDTSMAPAGSSTVAGHASGPRATDRPAAAAVPPRAADGAPRHAAPHRAALVRCEGVRRAFRGVQALAGVDLEVREGEILGLVGPNGSGKSTLVNVISGYYRPDAGRIALEGADLAGLPGHRIARLGVARTYQIPRPFARLTVLDNVVLAGMFGAAALDRGAATREARRWLEFVGLGARAASLPTALNLHQRKFLELARALAGAPRLVLLDEVLSGLTPAEMDDALALVRQIRARGATVVFIEHIMRAVLGLTDRVVVLNHGQVIAEGAPREVMRQPDVVAAYLGKARV